MRSIRQASFALRVVQRREGKAAIVYRRKADRNGHDRLKRLGAISPLAFTAATPLLREGIKQSSEGNTSRKAADSRTRANSLAPGPLYPLDPDWGARVACLAIISAGLRNAERLLLATNHLRNADANEAAWWLGLLTRRDNVRPLRALRILTEAVE